jgi:hypothetical protein
VRWIDDQAWVSPDWRGCRRDGHRHQRIKSGGAANVTRAVARTIKMGFRKPDLLEIPEHHATVTLRLDHK